MSFVSRVVFDTSTLVCAADWIVSSDDDLLSLNPYQRISIVTPKEFLSS